jgi:hypothetical protein
MPLFGIVSIPFWRWHVEYQIRSAPSEIDAPDPGQFGGFAVIAGAVATGLCGAWVGLAFIWLAKRRQERWPWLRRGALAVNVIGSLVGLILPMNQLRWLGYWESTPLISTALSSAPLDLRAVLAAVREATGSEESACAGRDGWSLFWPPRRLGGIGRRARLKIEF